MTTKPAIFKSRQDAPPGASFIDAFQRSIEELFSILNPSVEKNSPEYMNRSKKFLFSSGISDCFIYFPWKNTVIRLPEENIYFKLRTARNRNIIRENEQKNYRDLKIGIAGLSVGSAILSALAQTGGAKILKIADPDTIEATNLNRISANTLDLGQNKAETAARRVWELDPFADIYVYEKGVSKENLEKFILGEGSNPKIDIFIDEMDNIYLKVLARTICKKEKIPLLMATDNGDGVILDVERFDTEPQHEIFHGLLGEFKLEDFENMDRPAWIAAANKIIGTEFMSERLKESLALIGKELAGVSQLASAANIAGATVAYTARQIANESSLSSGKYALSPEKLNRLI